MSDFELMSSGLPLAESARWGALFWPAGGDRARPNCHTNCHTLTNNKEKALMVSHKRLFLLEPGKRIELSTY
jgi:hypothetical protein